MMHVTFFSFFFFFFLIFDAQKFLKLSVYTEF